MATLIARLEQVSKKQEPKEAGALGRDLAKGSKAFMSVGSGPEE